jgi:hypothetical protein
LDADLSLDQAGNPFRGNVTDIALSRRQLLNLELVHIKPDGLETRLREAAG